MTNLQFIERNIRGENGSLNYVELNPNSPKPETILLIHGISANWRDWGVSILSDISSLGYRTIAIDRPGMGYSDRNSDMRSLEDQASFIFHCVSILKLKDLILIGHSYGGSLSLKIALKYPKIVKGLMLLSAPTHPWEGGLGFLYNTLGLPFLTSIGSKLISLIKPRALIDSTLTDVFYPKEVPKSYKKGLNVDLTMRKTSLEWIIRDAKELKVSLNHMCSSYSKMKVPTKIIHCANDKIVPFDLHAQKLNEKISSSKLIRLTGIGHMPHHFKKNLIIQSLISLLCK